MKQIVIFHLISALCQHLYKTLKYVQKNSVDLDQQATYAARCSGFIVFFIHTINLCILIFCHLIECN